MLKKTTFNRILFLFLFVLVLTGTGAKPHTVEKMLVGPEFEFSNLKMIAIQAKDGLKVVRGKDEIFYSVNKENEAVLKKMYSAYLERFKGKDGYSVELTVGSPTNPKEFRVNYPDKFWFDVTLDPGVIEVKADPVIIEEWESRKAVLQADIFDFLKTNGVHPGWGFGFGAGHLNFSGEIFNNNLPLLRNFLVDYVNHAELAAGIHYGLVDKFNAKPLAMNEAQYTEFKKLIEDVDSSKIKTTNKLVAEFDARVYKEASREEIDASKGLDKIRLATGSKFSALVIHEDDYGRIERVEVRAMRSQNSVDEFIEFAGLYQGRISYLQELDSKSKIALMDRASILDRSTFMSRYQEFVEQSGKEFKPFKDKVPLMVKCQIGFSKILKAFQKN